GFALFNFKAGVPAKENNRFSALDIEGETLIGVDVADFQSDTHPSQRLGCEPHKVSPNREQKQIFLTLERPQNTGKTRVSNIFYKRKIHYENPTFI
ncbi:MAG: hypothetical protein KKB85_00820, partial [Candidatus Altiarchaeota archaeon]|nr:hypothetical protein [Candidatus Altiarchaeota archaeon]